VQARGAISVHALVRGTESLLPRPFARGRALKGEQAPNPTGTLSPSGPLYL